MRHAPQTAQTLNCPTLPRLAHWFKQVAAGNVILVGYVGLGTIAWTSTYVFRVANKDMTYAKQLRDYENAVIQKRFEELNNDEVDALMEEIYPEQAEEKEQKAQKPPAA